MRCPYCAAYPAPMGPQGAITTTGLTGNQARWQPAVCPSCGGVVIMQIREDDTIEHTYPDPAAGTWTVGHLTDAVEAEWNEAVLVFETGANASAVVACGRTLEAAAVERGMEKGTLATRIQKMQKDGIITTEFGKAVSYARMMRNVGAHGGGAAGVPRDAATGCMRFTLQALRILFEVPGELDELTGPPPELTQDESPQD